MYLGSLQVLAPYIAALQGILDPGRVTVTLERDIVEVRLKIPGIEKGPGSSKQEKHYIWRLEEHGYGEYCVLAGEPGHNVRPIAEVCSQITEEINPLIREYRRQMGFPI